MGTGVALCLTVWHPADVGCPSQLPTSASCGPAEEHGTGSTGLVMAHWSAFRGWETGTRGPGRPCDTDGCAPRLAEGVLACALLSSGFDAT
jgi:hypothetical protein